MTNANAIKNANAVAAKVYNDHRKHMVRGWDGKHRTFSVDNILCDPKVRRVFLVLCVVESVTIENVGPALLTDELEGLLLRCLITLRKQGCLDTTGTEIYELVLNKSSNPLTYLVHQTDYDPGVKSLF